MDAPHLGKMERLEIEIMGGPNQKHVLAGLQRVAKRGPRVTVDLVVDETIPEEEIWLQVTGKSQSVVLSLAA